MEKIPSETLLQKPNLVCILLAAGHAKKLGDEIENDESGSFRHLRGRPKALLPAQGGKCILDFWWDVIKTRQLFSEVYLVCNADKCKHFERWATASEFPLENLIIDGSTLSSNALGSLGDLELVLRTKRLHGKDITVIAGDMLFQDSKFDMGQVLRYFHHKKDGDLAIYYEMHPSEVATSRGIVEVCSQTNRITKFLEKPCPEDTESRLASVVFYCFRKETVTKMLTFIEERVEVSKRNFGLFMEWLINGEGVRVYGMKLPTGFQLIGEIGLEEYKSWVSYFSQQSSTMKSLPIVQRSYARIGLMGNPSDGFEGKTISMTIENFWAEVTLEESKTLRLIPHLLNDPTEFGSLADLHGISSKEGYLGGLRLLQATCKKFYNYCSTRGIALSGRNFSLSYDTNIPRQVGLAGSSAIVTSTIKCLIKFFNLKDSDIPKDVLPSFILSVEQEELRINAGLQDRVVQVYEGLVYMDFSPEVVSVKDHGNYYHLLPSSKMNLLPTFFLAYRGNPSDSGKIHSNVTQLWRSGDPDVIAGMKALADLTDKAADSILSANWADLASYMEKNFETRKKMYGIECLGQDNLEMIKIGWKYGASVKFPGSGGAILGLLLDNQQKENLKRDYQTQGCIFVEIVPHLSTVPCNCCYADE